MSDPKPAKPSARDYAMTVQIADREQAAGNFEAAAAIYRVVLAQIPAYVEGHAKLARALFCLKRWDEAWKAFDIRFKLMDSPPAVSVRAPDGSPRPKPRHVEGPLPGKLLVLSEQGMGDTIQFARFLPRLVEAGVQAQVVVPQRLFGLLRTLDPSPPLLPAEVPGSVTQVQAWTMMMDLPSVLGLREEDYLASKPYLRAEPARVARWRAWLGERKGPVIAFAWRGNPEHKVDGARSAKLEDMAPLAAIENATLVCLQQNATDEEIAACGFAEKIVRPGPDFDSGLDAFLDSAAILSIVDRLVCVDTSLIHLAGALHARAELLLHRHWADWRWLDEDTSNVWYPTLRIWRCAEGESYGELVARLAQTLQGEI